MTRSRACAVARDIEREAREFLNYQLLPLHEALGRLEDGIMPAFSSRLLADGAPGGRDGATLLAETDPELFAAIERLRRTPEFRLRFAWAQLRRGRR